MTEQQVLSVSDLIKKLALSHKSWPIMLALPALYFLYFHVAEYIAPAEDATILYRYSVNLAESGRISYNPEGEVAEGATDFLWMVILSAGKLINIDPYLLSRILSVLSLVGTYLIISRILESASSWLPAVIMFALLINSQSVAAIQGFSLFFFGFCVSLAVFSFIKGNESLLVIISFITVLTRPDGVVMVSPLILMYAIFCTGDRKSFIIKALFLAIIPGLIYFIWRWQYFGYLYPLPFYVKAANPQLGLLGESFLYEIKYLSKYLFPLFFGLLFIWLWGRKEIERSKLFACLSIILSLVVLPLIFYSRVRLEQNIADRFMYPVHLGMILVYVWLLNHFLMKRIKRLSRVLIGLGSLYLSLSFLYGLIFFKGYLEMRDESNFPLAVALADVRDVKFATTEAGRLPYYTKWESIDMWGLNTPDFSQRLIRAEDLEQFAPDMMMIDKNLEYRILLDSIENPYKRQVLWDNMVFNAFKYAWESGEYEFYAQPICYIRSKPKWMNSYIANIQKIVDWKLNILGGSPLTGYDMYHLYAIRKDSPYRDKLVKIILDQRGMSFEKYLEEFE